MTADQKGQRILQILSAVFIASLVACNLIFQKLNNILEKYNLKKMGTKKGDNFDSELHEAITSTPSEKKLKGKIVDVIEDGYLIGDKILRFAKVVIGL